METAIYVRVSTEEQAQEGFSIRAQQQKLKDYARIKEWSIYNIYIDEGISGKNLTERPAVKQMIKDIEKGLVKNVVVFKIDRLTRSTGDLAFLIDLFNEKNCAFNSLMESIDTQSPSGRMFIKIIGIFAEFERENIGERAKIGLERKAREGYSACNGQGSYGYDRPKGQKIQTINEEEAKIVREIFYLFVKKHESLTGIAKILNIKNIPTKNNATWKPHMVKTVLINYNHIGKINYLPHDEERGFIVDGLHEPIIEEDLFNEAQKIIAKNKQTTRTKKPRTENYYTGLIRCGDCGNVLKTHSSYYTLKDGTEKYSTAYRCKNKNFKACKGKFGGVSHTKVDRAFEKYINKISSLDSIDDLHVESQQEEIRKKNELIVLYNNKLEKLKNRESEVMGFYIDEKIEFDEYREMKEKIEIDRNKIKKEMEKIDIPEEEPSEINKEDIVLEFKENWTRLTNIEKRQFLMKFVKGIEVTTMRGENEKLWTVEVKNIEFV